MSPPSQLPFFLFLSMELLVVVGVLLLVAGPSPAAASKAFLKDECTHVNRPDVCMRLIGRERWAIGCSDTKCLTAGILNNLCLPKTRSARDFADRVWRRARESQKEAWETCVNAYNALEGSIESSIDDFNEGNLDEASRTLDSLEENINDCKPEPMRSWNQLVYDCTDVAGDFILDMI